MKELHPIQFQLQDILKRKNCGDKKPTHSWVLGAGEGGAHGPSTRMFRAVTVLCVAPEWWLPGTTH